MTVDGFGAIFGVACLGGVLAELAKWYSLRESPNFPDYARSARYWVITALVAMAGGVLAVLYGVDEPKNAVLVLNIGASAPLIIMALASTQPDNATSAGRPPATDPGHGGYGMADETAAEPAPSIGRFLAGR
jgi:hypothetical protein